MGTFCTRRVSQDFSSGGDCRSRDAGDYWLHTLVAGRSAWVATRHGVQRDPGVMVFKFEGKAVWIGAKPLVSP
jgi:hypothetical protein